MIRRAALVVLWLWAGCSDGADASRLLSGTVIRRAVPATTDGGTSDGGEGTADALEGADAAADAADGGVELPAAAVTLGRRGDILCSTSSGAAVLGNIDAFTGEFSLTAPRDETLSCWRIDAGGRLYPVVFLDGALALPPARGNLTLGAIFPSPGFFVSAIAAGGPGGGAAGDVAALAGDYDLQVDDGSQLGLRLIDRGAGAGGDGAGRWLLAIEGADGGCAQLIRSQVQRSGDQVFIGALQGDGDASAVLPDPDAPARFRLGLNGVRDGEGTVTGYLVWVDDHPDVGFAGPEVQAFVLLPRQSASACSDLEAQIDGLPGCAEGCELDAEAGLCLRPGAGPCDQAGAVLERACPAGCAVNDLALCWDVRVGAACCLDASWCPGSCLCRDGYCVEPDDPQLACQQ